jgi:hypothetical protein
MESRGGRDQRLRATSVDERQEQQDPGKGKEQRRHG